MTAGQQMLLGSARSDTYVITSAGWNGTDIGYINGLAGSIAPSSAFRGFVFQGLSTSNSGTPTPPVLRVRLSGAPGSAPQNLFSTVVVVRVSDGVAFGSFSVASALFDTGNNAWSWAVPLQLTNLTQYRFIFT